MGVRIRDARVRRAERRHRHDQQRVADQVFAFLIDIANKPPKTFEFCDAWDLAWQSLDDIVGTGTLTISPWIRCRVLRRVEDGVVHEISDDPRSDGAFVVYALSELAKWRRLKDVRRCEKCAAFFLRRHHHRTFCSSTCRLAAKSRRDTQKNRDIFGLPMAVADVQIAAHDDRHHLMIDTTMTTNAVADYAAKIRAARLDLELSKAELARMSGVPRGMIGQIERGLVPTSLVPLERLARALGMKL